jgi:hypothetical protein
LDSLTARNFRSHHGEYRSQYRVRPAAIAAETAQTPDQGIYDLSIPDQVRMAFRPSAFIAALFGAAFGGTIPVCSYHLIHHEVHSSPWLWFLAIGSLLFSTSKVYVWGLQAFAVPSEFGSRIIALGFTVGLEGYAAFGHWHLWTVFCLALIILMNACSCAVSIQARRDVPNKQ